MEEIVKKLQIFIEQQRIIDNSFEEELLEINKFLGELSNKLAELEKKLNDLAPNQLDL